MITAVEKNIFFEYFYGVSRERVGGGGEEIVKAFVSLPILSEKVKMFYHKTNFFFLQLV